MFHLFSLFSKKLDYRLDDDVPWHTFFAGDVCIYVRQFPSIHLLFDFQHKDRFIAAVPPRTPLEVRILIARSYFAGLHRRDYEWWTRPHSEQAPQA